jgi:Ran GTPase-activating protein (RanGAP) involved in mRNA processing and transport
MQEAAAAAADPATRQVEDDIQRALANASTTELSIADSGSNLTALAGMRIIDCLLQRDDNSSRRFDTLSIWLYHAQDVAVWQVFRHGLPLCTSLNKVKLQAMKLDNEGLEILRPAFYNTSITSLDLSYSNRIEGKRGGEVLRKLLVGNETLLELSVRENPLGPEGARGPGRGLAGNQHLQKLNLFGCRIGNEGLASLLTAFGAGGATTTTKSTKSTTTTKSTTNRSNNNNTLTHLDLAANTIKDAEGGRQVTAALRCFQQLKVLILNHNDLGPLGARTLAPGVAAAKNLQRLELSGCWFGNEGVASLVPDGHVNTSLTVLDLKCNSTPSLALHGETAIRLARRCTNLDRLLLTEDILSPPDQRRRLELLLDRKRLCCKAATLAGAPFSVLISFVLDQAHGHEHGLSAIFLILQNDGEDHFCTANNRAIE